MKHLSIAGLILAAAFALSGISASSASAAWCFKILNTLTETGNFNKASGANCVEAGGSKEFIKGTLDAFTEPYVAFHFCAEVEAGQRTGVTGWVTLEGCQEVNGTPAKEENARWIRVAFPENKGGTKKPEFAVLPSVKTLKGTTGQSTLMAGTNSIICEKGTHQGEITSMDTISKIVVKFTGCKDSSGGTTCTAKSIGAGTGEIVTTTLKGSLGSVKSTEAASEVGLLVSPESGTKLTQLASTACTPETSVNGSVAGEVVSISTKQSHNWVLFGTMSGAQNIKTISVLSGKSTPELEAFGLSATEVLADEVESPGEIEIT